MLDDTEFLIFSSHKTSTQSLLHTLNDSHYKTTKIHIIKDAHHWNHIGQDDKTFLLQEIKKYKEKNHKRLKVITVIRPPIERFISSFFQTNADNEVFFAKKRNILESTAIQESNRRLYDMFIDSLKHKSSDYYKESLYELAELFDSRIFQQLVPRKDHFYYENEWIELYVLDFKQLNDPRYLNRCLPVKIEHITPKNITEQKIYSPKYKNFKDTIMDIEDYKHEVLYSIQTFYPNKEEYFFFYHFRPPYSSNAATQIVETFSTASSSNNDNMGGSTTESPLHQLCIIVLTLVFLYFIFLFMYWKIRKLNWLVIRSSTQTKTKNNQ
jgi:hypothetical protein